MMMIFKKIVKTDPEQANPCFFFNENHLIGNKNV